MPSAYAEYRTTAMSYTPLNSLNAFVAVARRRSFAAAARELGISSSALSQSVRQLETKLGVSLLARSSRSVAPTAAGERLCATPAPPWTSRSRRSRR